MHLNLMETVGLITVIVLAILLGAAAIVFLTEIVAKVFIRKTRFPGIYRFWVYFWLPTKIWLLIYESYRWGPGKIYINLKDKDLRGHGERLSDEVLICENLENNKRSLLQKLEYELSLWVAPMWFYVYLTSLVNEGAEFVLSPKHILIKQTMPKD